MYPWPVAHTYWQGERFKIQEAVETGGEGPVGQVIARSKKELVIATGQGALSLKTVQPAGKPKWQLWDFGMELVEISRWEIDLVVNKQESARSLALSVLETLSLIRELTAEHRSQ